MGKQFSTNNFFKKINDINIFSYDAKTMIRKMRIGVINKKDRYELNPKFDNFPTNSLMQIILPDSHIPIISSFKHFIPHVKKRNNRLVITWPFEKNIDERLQFHKVTKNKFDKFSTSGANIQVKISPKIQATLQSIGRKGYDEFKDITTTTNAKVIQGLIESI